MKILYLFRRNQVKSIVLFAIFTSYLLIAYFFWLSDPIFWNEKEMRLRKLDPTTDEYQDGDEEDYCQHLFSVVQSAWKHHICYSILGVDGTRESIESYVHQVHPTCFQQRASDKLAHLQTNLTELLAVLSTDKRHANSDKFMQTRVQRLWPQWTAALNRYKQWVDRGLAQSESLGVTRARGQPRLYNRAKLHIHLHLGLLTLNPSIGIEEKVNQGGPLGELVQWTDLIAALHLLGHKVTVSKNIQTTINLLKQWRFDRTPCKSRSPWPNLLYTDIRGYEQLQRRSAGIPNCKYRILDSFGTENKYNLAKRSQYSGLKLKLQQFQTFFPHTPDNTFLGFVIEQPDETENVKRESIRKPIALVAGKALSLWRVHNVPSYLKVLSEFFEIHSTVADVTNANQLPDFITNHKAVFGKDFQSLLKSAKVLVGLGFPYESPAPLEAISQGVIFLNVKFTPPHNKRNTPFLENKPTDRMLTSQHSYIEDYIGEPHSYLLDPDNAEQIRTTIRRLLATPVQTGYTPFEFTPTGYLERLNGLLEHQDFCHQSISSTTQEGFIPILAPVGWSCNQACESIDPSEPTSSLNSSSISSALLADSSVPPGYLTERYSFASPGTSSRAWHRLRCAPEHFPSLNHADQLARWFNILCKEIKELADLTAPYVDVAHGVCTLQADLLHFSCAYSNPLNEVAVPSQRICPCRRPLPGQTTISEWGL